MCTRNFGIPCVPPARLQNFLTTPSLTTYICFFLPFRSPSRLLPKIKLSENHSAVFPTEEQVFRWLSSFHCFPIRSRVTADSDRGHCVKHNVRGYTSLCVFWRFCQLGTLKIQCLYVEAKHFHVIFLVSRCKLVFELLF